MVLSPDEAQIRACIAIARASLSPQPSCGELASELFAKMAAALVFDLFGDELLRTRAPAGPHFYNRLRGGAVDFASPTTDQPPIYENRPAEIEEALEGVSPSDYERFKAAFLRAYLANGRPSNDDRASAA